MAEQPKPVSDMTPHLNGSDSDPTTSAHITGSTADNTMRTPDENTTTHNFAASLLTAGHLTQGQFDILPTLIQRDLSKACLDVFRYSAAGNVTIRHDVTKQQLAATAKVFNTAELLEMILLHVPAADLIPVVPRVCKGFSQAVEASTELKRITYRVPTEPADVYPICFPVAIPGIRIQARQPSGHGTRQSSEKRKSRLHTHQLAISAARSVRLLSVDMSIYEYERRHGKQRMEFLPAVWNLQCHAGVTFGDLLDIVERASREEWDSAQLSFSSYSKVTGEEESSHNARQWMAGEPMEWKRGPESYIKRAKDVQLREWQLRESISSRSFQASWASMGGR